VFLFLHVTLRYGCVNDDSLRRLDRKLIWTCMRLYLRFEFGMFLKLLLRFYAAVATALPVNPGMCRKLQFFAREVSSGVMSKLLSFVGYEPFSNRCLRVLSF